MRISHVNYLCFLFLDFLGATGTGAIFLQFSSTSGPCLITNRKALILHEPNIDHGFHKSLFKECY